MRWALVILLAACSGSEASPAEAPPTGELGQIGNGQPEPEPAPEASPEEDLCANLRAQTASILSEPVTPCQVDAECACYPAFINCGGVLHTARASRLQPLATRGQSLGCGYQDLDGNQFNCAPRACASACENDVCVNR